MVVWNVVVTNPETGQELLRKHYKSIKEMIPECTEVLKSAGCEYYDINSAVIKSIRCQSVVPSKRFVELRRWFSFDKVYVPQNRPVMASAETN